MAQKRVTRRADGSSSGEIGVRDPFQLVRHLARSQSDPRKAVAELVQNALDEQASHIVIERGRVDGEPVLSILDDGKGVLPELTRPEALTSIARNIGHSRKRKLSFDERMRQAMLGQYGIGILGFWSLGHELRMISRVSASEAWCLTLVEDSPKFEVERVPIDMSRGATWTEVQIVRLHQAALGPTVGSRLAAYLSVELQGQLKRHATELTILDRIARGSADKRIVVKPNELAGERLEGLGPVPVPGYEQPIELVLHYLGETRGGGQVKVACAGSLVLDDVCALPELEKPPWNLGRLVGVIDFPHLEVPPGSRRGIQPNDASLAFVSALGGIEAELSARLAEREAAENARLSADTHRQLARMFARVTELVPHLEWLPVVTQDSALRDSGERAPGAPISPPEPEDQAEAGVHGDQVDFFPPGPLAELRIVPRSLELAFGHERSFVAKGFDAQRRQIGEGLALGWSVEGPVELLSQEGAGVQLRAGTQAGTAKLRATAEGFEAEAEIRVMAVVRPRRPDQGVPQPIEVNDPLEAWRSRTVGERWEINTGHADYKVLAEDARRRLRYLALLLGKEIITKNFPRPELGGILEEFVGLLAALERSGAWLRSPGQPE